MDIHIDIYMWKIGNLYKSTLRYVLLENRKDIQTLCRYLHKSIDIYINPYGHTPKCSSKIKGTPLVHLQLTALWTCSEQFDHSKFFFSFGIRLTFWIRFGIGLLSGRRLPVGSSYCLRVNSNSGY